MLRNIAIVLTGTGLLVLAPGCDDETSDGTGGSTTTPTGTTASGGEGGSAGSGATGGNGTGGSGASGGSMPVNACEPGVESEVVCPSANMRCTQSTGCCECMGIDGCGLETIWICVEPPGDAECPATPPTYNETCTPDGTLCEYCTSGNAVELWRCHNGVWVERMPTCSGPV